MESVTLIKVEGVTSGRHVNRNDICPPELLKILNEAPGATQKISLVWSKVKVISFPTPEKVEHGDPGENGPQE